MNRTFLYDRALSIFLTPAFLLMATPAFGQAAALTCASVYQESAIRAKPADLVSKADATFTGEPTDVVISEIGGGQYLSQALLTLQQQNPAKIKIVSVQSPYDRSASDQRYGDLSVMGTSRYTSLERVTGQLNREEQVLTAKSKGRNQLIMTSSAVTEPSNGFVIVGVRYLSPVRSTMIIRARLKSADTVQQKKDLANIGLQAASLAKSGITDPQKLLERLTTAAVEIEFFRLESGSQAPIEVGSPERVLDPSAGTGAQAIRKTVAPPENLNNVDSNIFWLNVTSGARVFLTEVGIPLGISQRIAGQPFNSIYKSAYFENEGAWAKDHPQASSVGFKEITAENVKEMQLSDVKASRQKVSLVVNTQKAGDDLIVTVALQIHSSSGVRRIETLNFKVKANETEKVIYEITSQINWMIYEASLVPQAS